MSTNLLSFRNRSVSQVSLRKRVLRTNSQDRPRKQLNKNQTATSFRPKLQRLIHEGKIQMIVNSDNHSKANLYYTNHINDMQKQLASSKKALSSMVLKAKSKQFNINKLKSEIKRLEMERESIKSQSERVNKIYQGTLQNLDSKKVQKEISEWTERSYISLKQRLSKDQNYFRAQYEYLQRQFQIQKNRQQHLDHQNLQVLSHYRQLQNFINTAKQITSKQTDQKNQFIDLLNMEMQEKQFLNQLRIDKHKKQAEINQISPSVIQKEELHKYLNILYTHRILSKILKTKNNNLLKKYEKVQNAYMYIKSNTNIIQFDKIIKKMEEQDSIYDVTVKKVASLQVQLQRMEKTIQIAKLQRNRILSQQGECLNLQKHYYNGIQRDRYELLLSQKQKWQSKNMQDQILKNRINNWASRLFESFNVINDKNTFQGNLKELVDKIKVLIKKDEKIEQ